MQDNQQGGTCKWYKVVQHLMSTCYLFKLMVTSLGITETQALPWLESFESNLLLHFPWLQNAVELIQI